MFRYLPGILIVQIATVAMLLAGVKSGDPELWIAIGVLALIIGVVTAFWFGSIAGHIKKDAVARAREAFSLERENLRLNAERQKSRILKKSHAQLLKETNRVHARTSFKLGAGFIAIVAAGAFLIFSQFLTLGLLMLSTGGGALAGYLIRARQEMLARRRQAPPASPPVPIDSPLVTDDTSIEQVSRTGKTL